MTHMLLNDDRIHKIFLTCNVTLDTFPSLLVNRPSKASQKFIVRKTRKKRRYSSILAISFIQHAWLSILVK